MRLKRMLMLSSFSSCLIFLLFSCGDAGDLNNKAKIAWDFKNSPERIGLNSSQYETRFFKLKKKATLTVKPWSGSYWPTYRGGISYRWNHPTQTDEVRAFYKLESFMDLNPSKIKLLSPSEKMDLLLGDENYSITKSERQRTGVLKRMEGEDIPTWFGLCHAWAPATLFYKSPSPVTMTRNDGLEIPFGSSDIKALLIYFLNTTPSKDYFASRRCDIDDKALRKDAEEGLITFEEYTRRMESAHCIGINPGAFHIILGNMIGKKDEGFVADITRDAEVWNQAVHGYSSRILDTRTDFFSKDADPGTVKEIKVATSMHYTTEIDASWDDTISLPSEEKANYRYWLELDENNNIIGGTWISKDRPDFLWKLEKPKFPLRYKKIEELYKRSVGTWNGTTGLETTALKLKASNRKKVFTGTVFKLSGEISQEVTKLKIRYFNKRGHKLFEKTFSPKDDLTFNTNNFFFDFVKPHTAKLLAFDQNKKLIDILEIKL